LALHRGGYVTASRRFDCCPFESMRRAELLSSLILEKKSDFIFYQ